MQRLPPASRQDLLTIMSTEHFTLQGARSAAISDANGRASFFLSTLSAGVVALAFVAQVAQTGPAFIVLALILLPTLLVIGLASFERLLQLGIENIRTVVAINRVRRYYLEVAPELRPHFTLSDCGRRAGRPDEPGLDPRRHPALGPLRHQRRARRGHRRDRGRRARHPGRAHPGPCGGAVRGGRDRASARSSSAPSACISRAAGVLAIRIFGVRFSAAAPFEQTHPPVPDDARPVVPPSA